MKDNDQRPSYGSEPKSRAQAPPIGTAEAKASRRVDALFKAVSSDYLLREQFVTDPAQTLAEFVAGRRLPEDSADAANQLLYAVLSNARLRNWLAEYARHLRGATPSRQAFAVQFARALGTAGDNITALALIRAATGRDLFVVQADLLRAFITVLGGQLGSSGTEVSPGGGTEVSPGGGTEVSPGAIFSAGTEMSPGGTEMSPGAIFFGAGTEMSPGGTEMSPGAIFSGGRFSGTDQSPGFGTEQSGTHMSPGAVLSGTDQSPGFGTEQSGTHMSPGAVLSGTDQSPGFGTEQSGTHMSPGAIVGLEIPGYLRTTLNALVVYATQLRARGALSFTGFEQRF